MDHLKIAGDMTSGMVIFATLGKLLPPLAAFVAILWHVFQFWNSVPFQQWRLERRQRKEKKDGS